MYPRLWQAILYDLTELNSQVNLKKRPEGHGANGSYLVAQWQDE